MKGYSKTDTIILWSENKEIIKYTHELAKELGVQVFEPEVISDLVAIPCFFKIIDAKHLLEFLYFLGSDASINEYFYYNDCKIALLKHFQKLSAKNFCCQLLSIILNRQ